MTTATKSPYQAYTDGELTDEEYEAQDAALREQEEIEEQQPVELAQLLKELLEAVKEDPEDYDHGLLPGDARVQHVATFENTGLLTRDSGVVVQLNDGSEFQVSIVRSARRDR